MPPKKKISAKDASKNAELPSAAAPVQPQSPVESAGIAPDSIILKSMIAFLQRPAEKISSQSSTVAEQVDITVPPPQQAAASTSSHSELEDEFNEELITVDPISAFSISPDRKYMQYLIVYLIELAYQAYVSSPSYGTFHHGLHDQKISIALGFVHLINELENQDPLLFLKRVSEYSKQTYDAASAVSAKASATLGQFDTFNHRVQNIVTNIRFALDKNNLLGLAEKSFSELSQSPSNLLLDHLYRLYLLPHQLLNHSTIFEHLTSNNPKKLQAKITLVEKTIQRLLAIREIEEILKASHQKELLRASAQQLEDLLNTLVLEDQRIEKEMTCVTDSATAAVSSVVSLFYAPATSTAQPAAFTLPSLLEIIEQARVQLHIHTATLPPIPSTNYLAV